MTLRNGDYEKGTPFDECLYREVRGFLENYWRSADGETKGQLEETLRSLDALFALRRSEIGEYVS